MRSLFRLYMTIRKPKNFLILLLIFIGTSLILHHLMGIDPEFGATNLILSIEASTASAVLMMVAEESADLQRQTVESQGSMLAALLAIAEAQRDMLTDHTALLRAIREADERLLKALTNPTEE
jgi:predicted tellurium resistance membrane protein TerC